MAETSGHAAPWSGTHANAWVGLLETTKQLTRALDAELEARHGLSLSGFELLARLAPAPGRQLRLSVLALHAGLSLSRVSRLVDALELRGLLRRVPCPDDARAVEAHLTPAGMKLAGQAQVTHGRIVQDLFFDHVSDREAATMAKVFARLTPPRANGAPAPGATGGHPATG